MSERAFRFLIRHRSAVLILAAAWGIAGLAVVAHTPMDAVPDLSENQVLVSADWPGQSPSDTERQITRPLSLALQGVDGVRTVRGSSDVGYSLIHVIFKDEVPFTEARRRVESRLAGREHPLPAGVVPRLAPDGIPTGQIFWYTVEGTETDLAALRTLQDTVVAPMLRSVPGVAEVASVGGFVPELHVTADLDRLAEHGAMPGDLSTGLRALAEPAVGQVVQTSNSEFLVRVLPPLGQEGAKTSTPSPPGSEECDAGRDTVQRLEQMRIALPSGASLRLGDVAHVSWGVAPRRGVFEKDGSEMVAGIVHLRYGHNPLVVSRAVQRRLREIAPSLPSGVRLVPCYDRTPLIAGAVGTVTRTLIESLLVASLCVILVMRHWRTSLVITLTLPLAVLGTFLGMAALRVLHVADVQTNIMSLAGIVVSIGVLVDSSIVVADNVTHELRRRFGDQPVTGDVSETIARASATVAVPAFCSTLIMIISFLPVFALGGIDGNMFRPLAWTKTLALLAVAFLTVTLVPVLCATFIRGRVREESESVLVSSLAGVYRPVLAWLFDHPAPLVLFLCATLLLAAAATGVDWLVRITTAASVVAGFVVCRRRTAAIAAAGAAVLLGLVLQSTVRPIGLALRLPLDEGMVMDMPISVPRISITQAADDLKARNMVLCRFPEVRMVAGKAGRAETLFDPAPLDMIETMVEFRPRSCWPARRLKPADARRQAHTVVAALTEAGLVEASTARETLEAEIVEAGMVRFDAVQREVAWQRQVPFQAELSRELARRLVEESLREWKASNALSHLPAEADVLGLVGELSLSDVNRLGETPDAGTVAILQTGLRTSLQRRGWISSNPDAEAFTTAKGGIFQALWTAFGIDAGHPHEELAARLLAEQTRRWEQHVASVNEEMKNRAAGAWTQIVCSELFARQPILDEALARTWRQVLDARYGVNQPVQHHAVGHTGMPPLSKLPIIDPHPVYDAIVRRLTKDFGRGVWLWPQEAESLTRPGGEMDLAVQMPGWTNVWTRPIQNRIDMLATGVNSEVGIRVLGRDFDTVVRASEEIAAVLREMPGAADVIADPVRGKEYLEIRPDPRRAAEAGVVLHDLQEIIGTAAGGQVLCRVDDGERTWPVRLKISGAAAGDADSIGRLRVPVRSKSNRDPRGGNETAAAVPLETVADLRVVDGPAAIKSENGWLRNYVRLNVRGRDPAEFVASARGAVAARVELPAGVFLEWTGQFEHAAQTRSAILGLLPVIVALIFLILYATYLDFADAALMLLAVPGALAGGVLCQWLLGFPFSVAVGVGYVACFGMAAATGIVMLVYLRQAVDRAGGLEALTLAGLKEAILQGAVHRLRPKLLTEATTILSLAPMLWSSGIGADVIRPMAAPVLGGLLIADEVVDLLLPVAFYFVRRRRWRAGQVQSQSVDSASAHGPDIESQ